MQAGKIGLDIKIGSIFKHQTILGICAAQDANVEMAPVAGEVFASLSPYQHAVLESGAAAARCWHVQVEVGPDITETHFRQWVKDTLASQGALLSVIQEKDGSHGVIRVEANRERLRSVVNVHDVSGMRAEAVAATVEAARADAERTLATLQGLLLRAALFVGDASSTGMLSVHRALLDKAQWDTLSEQFRRAFTGAAR
jgi:hypothetical protein